MDTLTHMGVSQLRCCSNYLLVNQYQECNCRFHTMPVVGALA
jgi:hypothetical protein